jgi:hypothetical protein
MPTCAFSLSAKSTPSLWGGVCICRSATARPPRSVRAPGATRTALSSATPDPDAAETR